MPGRAEQWAEAGVGALVLAAAAGFLVYALGHASGFGGSGGGYELTARFGDVGSLTPGADVLVLGAGPIGLCTVAGARHLGADVDLEGHRPNRVAAADRLGASIATGADYDVVLDAAGTQSSLDRAIELTRPGGTISILGTYWRPVELGLAVQMKELTLLPSFTYGHHHGMDEFAEAARILRSVPDLADALNTHHFALDDAAEAFRVAGDPSEGPIKVVVHP